MQFPFAQISERKHCPWVGFGKFAALITVTSLFLFGCHGRDGVNLAAKLPAEMAQSIIQSQWRGQSVKVGNISYESPVLSKGGQVPRGIKLYPAKVRVSVNGGPEKGVLLYFYQNAFGGWEAYKAPRKAPPKG